MNEYFESEEKQKELRTEIEKWKGTQFIYNMGGHGAPGVAADCVSFPIAVFKHLGLIKNSFTTPTYLSIRGGRKELDKIYAGIDSINNLKKIWDVEDSKLEIGSLKIGDVLICSSGRFIHHLLIYSENRKAWHCYPNIGVSETYILIKSIKENLRRVYRFYDNV